MKLRDAQSRTVIIFMSTIQKYRSTMAKTIEEMDQKIRSGKAVVFTAEEIIDVVKEKRLAKAAAKVDVVTTGTFGPMCSSAAYFNIGHSKPRKAGAVTCTINDVPGVYRIRCREIMIGATALPDDDPLNSDLPGRVQLRGRPRHRGSCCRQRDQADGRLRYGLLPLPEAGEMSIFRTCRMLSSSIPATPTRTTMWP